MFPSLPTMTEDTGLSGIEQMNKETTIYFLKHSQTQLDSIYHYIVHMTRKQWFIYSYSLILFQLLIITITGKLFTVQKANEGYLNI